MRKVVKFGGSSLADAAQFQKVCNIIRSDVTRRYVVPSAPGKRSSDDTKVTDMLYDAYRSAKGSGNFLPKLQAIQERYDEIIQGLKLNLSLEKEFDQIRSNFENGIGV